VKHTNDLYEKIRHLNKVFNKNDQRAALLERNKPFLAELTQIKESIPDFSSFQIIKSRYPDSFLISALEVERKALIKKIRLLSSNIQNINIKTGFLEKII